MKSLAELHNIHGDATIAVIGGGPKVMEDLHQIPKDAIIISANQHGFAAGLKPSYLVFGDNPEWNPAVMREIVARKNNLIVLSQLEKWTDYSYSHCGMWGAGDSGMRAVWTACYLTTGTVIVTGINLYTGKKRYFHDDVKESAQHTIRYLNKLNKPQKWKLLKGIIDNPARIRATDGCYDGIFTKIVKKTGK